MTESNQRKRLRIAILATPRSGNTWLRSLLTSIYGLETIVCDRPEEIDWAGLPERCIIQLHWGAEPELIGTLRAHGVQAVTIARHPIDTLISMLHFSTTWSKTSLWFDGRGGTEDSIRGCLPTSAEFLEYATGPRACALMSISAEWWQIAGCGRLCYESLVNDPETELTSLTAQLEPVSAEAIREARDGNSLERLKPRVQNQHYWQGSPGHWTQFVPAQPARSIAEVHRASFERHKYSCEPDESLTPIQADLNWFAVEIRSLRQELSRTRSQLFDANRRLDDAHRKSEELVSHLGPLCEVGPKSIQVARRLHETAIKHPRLHAAVSRWISAFSRRAG
ncbi:MAG TPA: hypothetical protein VL475_08905 [Planctomycetaceae bacterium]|nr:hypothetical protein [Planctomycetaceae bacterium]